MFYQISILPAPLFGSTDSKRCMKLQETRSKLSISCISLSEFSLLGQFLLEIVEMRVPHNILFSQNPHSRVSNARERISMQNAVLYNHRPPYCSSVGSQAWSMRRGATRGSRVSKGGRGHFGRCCFAIWASLLVLESPSVSI